ncbi:MAG: glycosyltransferase, partial [Lentisphaerae bacterium]|nr:glycosyltransferase [Lentisphaerota bacterium]
MNPPPLPGSPAQRFLAVSGYFPPIVGGTSTVIRTLLSAFRPESFSVIGETPGSFDGRHDDPDLPAAQVERIGIPGWIARLPFGFHLTRRLRFALIPRIARLIQRRLAASGAERLVAVYPSWPFLIAAYHAHRRTRVPLIVYYMDITIDDPSNPSLNQRALRRYEEPLLRAAARRLTLSEAVAENLTARYELDCVTIPHAVSLPASPPAPPSPSSLSAFRFP